MGTKSIVGAGNAVVTMTSGTNNADLSSLNVSGSETARFTGNTNFSGGTLADTDTIEVTSGTLTLSGSQLSNQTITGAGNITVNASGTVDLSGVTNSLSGTLTINDSSSADTITGTNGAETVNLNAGGLDNLDARNGNDTINLSQNVTSINGGAGTDTLNVKTTATIGTLSNVENLNIEATNDLTAYDLSDVNNLDVDGASVVTATMTLSQYTTLGSANITRGSDDKIALTNVTGNITSENLADATSISLNGNTTMTVAQVNQFAGNITKNGNTITVLDTASNIEGNIVSLYSNGVNSVDASDTNLDVTVAEATSGIAFTASDVITLKDTNANFVGVDFVALKTAGIDRVDETSGNSITVTVNQALAGITFVDSTVIVSDTAANIQAANFANLQSAGVTNVDSTNNTLTLNATQASSGIDFTAADVVTVSDTASNIVARIGSYGANVDNLDASDTNVSISVAQANTLNTANTTFVAGDNVTVVDTQANINGANFTTLKNNVGVDNIDVSGTDSITVTVAQSLAGINFVDSTVIVSDSQSNIEAANFTNLANAGVTNVDSTDNTLNVSVAQATTSGITFTSADLVTLTDTQGNLNSVDFSALAAKNVDRVDASGTNSISVTVNQALAGLTFVDTTVTVTDTASNIQAANFANLQSAGVTNVDSTNDTLTLNATQASSNIDFTAADVVTVSDTASNIVARIGSYGSNVDNLDASDTNVSISVSQANTLNSSNTTFVAGDNVTVVDTQGNINGANFTTLKNNVGVDNIDVSGTDSITVSVTQALAGINFVDSTVTVSDSQSNIEAANFANLQSAGVTNIDSTNNTLNVSVTQATAGITFTAADTVTVVDSQANIGAQNFTNLKNSGIDRVDVSGSSTITVTVDQALAGITFVDTTVIVSDTQANIEAANFANLQSAGVTTLDSTTGSLNITHAEASAGLNFTASDTVTLVDSSTVLNSADYSSLGSNIDSINATDNNVTLSVNQANDLDSYGVAFDVSDTVVISDSQTNIQNANFTNLASVGISDVRIDSTSDNLTVNLTQASTSGIVFTSSDAVVLSESSASLSSANYSLLKANIDSINASDAGTVSLDKTQVTDVKTYGIAFDSGDNVTFSDTGANISSVSFQDMVDIGVDTVDASDNVLTVSVDDTTKGISFTSGDTITVADSQANIESADFTTLLAQGVDIVDSSNDTLNINVTEANSAMQYVSGDSVNVSGTSGSDNLNIGTYDFKLCIFRSRK